MKRIMWIFAVLLCMTFAALSINAGAEEVTAAGSTGDNGLSWTLSADGTLTLSGKAQVDEDANVHWNSYSDQIKKVVITEGVNAIPGYSFWGMKNLTEVIIPETVEEIGDAAFQETGLRTVTIPAKVKVIGASVFEACYDLEEVNIVSGSQLESIGDRAFAYCQMPRIDLPATVKTIGKEAFYYCSKLTGVDLKDGIQTIGKRAFANCVSLSGHIYLPESITSFGGITTFEGVTGINSVQINADCSVQFAGCTQLTEAGFGGKASGISSDAFRGCTDLLKVTIDAPIKGIGSDAFNGCTKLSLIELPDGLVSIGKSAFRGTQLVSVKLPDTVTVVDWSAFAECKKLLSVECGKGLTLLGQGAFQGCTSLSAVDLGNVTIIEKEAFKGCSSLEYVVWPEELQSIGEDAFRNCYKLPSVTLAPSVTYIGSKAFKTCTGLKKIVFLGDAPTFDYVAGYVDDQPFCSVTATVYYPAGNTTWNEQNMRNYDGEITWVPLCKTHTETVVPAEKATCAQSGRTESAECATCGVCLKDWHIIPALAHRFAVTQTQATCDVDGMYVHTCAGCGYQYEIPYEDAFGHSYGDWDRTVEPQHGVKGEERRICLVCSYSETRTLEALRHSYGEWVRVKEPDYGVEGEERLYCTGCDHYEIRVVAALIPEQPSETMTEPIQQDSKDAPAVILWEIVVAAVVVLASGSVTAFVILKKKRQ